MGRYSPTVVPEVPDPLRVIDSMYSGYLSKQEGDRADRRLDVTEKEATGRELDRELGRYEAGFRDIPEPAAEQPESPRPRAPLFPEGQGPRRIGLQPAQREGIPALLDQARAQYEPEVLAKPGALIPGVNTFADRPIMAPPPPQRQGIGDTGKYFDEEQTPQARSSRAQRENFDYTSDRRQREQDEDYRSKRAAAGGVYKNPAEAEAVTRGVPLPRLETTPSGRNTTATYSQARDDLLAPFKVKNAEGWVTGMNFPPGVTEMQINALAQQVADGEISMEEVDAMYRVWGVGQPPDPGTRGLFGGLDSQSFDDYTQNYGFGGREEEEEALLSDEDVMSVRESFQGLSRGEVTQILRDEGYGTKVIEQIIGGR